MRCLLAPAVLCSLVLAAPARGAKGTVEISTFEFRPARVVIAASDAVTWRWDGPDTDHSVIARSGQGRAFDSDPGLSAPNIDHRLGFTFTQTFPRPGIYGYFCKVHPSMRGAVVVRSRADRSPPGVRSLRVSPAAVCASRGCPRGAIHVRFKLSERARVLLRIARGGTFRGQPGLERSRKLRGRRGTNDLRIVTRGLAPGRYRLTLTATDAIGNASKPAKTSFRVRRAARPGG